MFLLVPAYPGSPGQKDVKRLCVCVSVSPIISTSTGQIFTRFSLVGSAMAVDEQSEPRFSHF